MVVFEEKGEPELWEENLSKQGPETNQNKLNRDSLTKAKLWKVWTQESFKK